MSGRDSEDVRAGRLAVDTGGTFTDLALELRDGSVRVYKSPTTLDDPTRGVLEVVARAADDLSKTSSELLGEASLFVYATTRAINAIITGETARTAFLTTRGHPDVLVFREGGRTGAFDFTLAYPEPYIPRALTFEVPERIGALGDVVHRLDEEGVIAVIEELKAAEVEAVGVCLLWSIVNPAHELRVGELLDEHLHGVPFSLSHLVNPAIREYRRASSACIDASLKPVMTGYLEDFERRLRAAGFDGRTLVVTSSGMVMDAADVAASPIHAINSGPAMAPIAGRLVAEAAAASGTAIVADTGGTSYDVSLVRDGRIPTTRDAWIGDEHFGHMTGLPSVDVRSIGAGGGSIAHVDEGGLLHVGPRSAGSLPGPVAYGRGGSDPTTTDASLVLGYIDPSFFLGGAMALDVEAARASIEERIARPLDMDVFEASSAVIELATEHMVSAIERITVNQGVDPATAVLVGGGGAAGLNAVAIARRLSCPRVLISGLGAILSAVGALHSDLGAEFERHLTTTSQDFDFEGVNGVLTDLLERGKAFIENAVGSEQSRLEFFVEARYLDQIWELEVPLRTSTFSSSADVSRLSHDFHAVHQRVFAISSPESPIELITWRARASCVLYARTPAAEADPTEGETRAEPTGKRQVYFRGLGSTTTPVYRLDQLSPKGRVQGPAIIESSFSSIVLDPEAEAVVTQGRGLSLLPEAKDPQSTVSSKR
ncbi:MAG: hydantoinase/oxoprolinase family protein [Solirubrobacterales bacterium]